MFITSVSYGEKDQEQKILCTIVTSEKWLVSKDKTKSEIQVTKWNQHYIYCQIHNVSSYEWSSLAWTNTKVCSYRPFAISKLIAYSNSHLHQVRVMKHLFQEYRTPTMVECEFLGQEIGLPKRVVQVWFQNARAKEKKAKLASGKSLSPEADFTKPPEECQLCRCKYTHKVTVSFSLRRFCLSLFIFFSSGCWNWVCFLEISKCSKMSMFCAVRCTCCVQQDVHVMCSKMYMLYAVR